MTALSIGLGIGHCIPVLSGDIPIPEPETPPPVEPGPPPELLLSPDATVEIGISDGTAVVTIADTGLYDGSHEVQSTGFATGPVFLAAPVLAGGPELGATVTARPGLLMHPSGRVPVVACQWHRDGAEIPGATGLTHILVAADQGKHLTVTETATNADGTRISTSAVLAIPLPAGIWQATGGAGRITVTQMPGIAPPTATGGFNSITITG